VALFRGCHGTRHWQLVIDEYIGLGCRSWSLWFDFPHGSLSTPQPVEFPRQNVPPMSMDDGLKLAEAWMAEQQVREFNNALVIDSSTTSSSPERNKRKYEEVECGVAPCQVKFPRHEQRNENMGSGNGFLANWWGQTPLATGVWHNGAHSIAPNHEDTPGRCISQELACRVAVAEPGSQTPGVAVNSVALRLPHLELPSDNHGATASGSHSKKILNETSQVVQYQCDECTQSKCRPITFSSKKDLHRHLTRTVTHNAPLVARCSCGKTVNSEKMRCDCIAGSAEEPQYPWVVQRARVRWAEECSRRRT